MTIMRLGKVGQPLLQKLVYHNLGGKRPEVSVGPKSGVDTSMVNLGGGKVLVTTTDPLSLVPSVGASESAWLSAHLIASDISTTGLAPTYGVFDFNLPPSMADSVFASYWKSFHRACKELGIAIIGGHTGRYAGCDYSIIGGGVMMTIGDKDKVLTSAMANVGDDLILTKGAAIESTAVLTRAYPYSVRRALGPRLFEKALEYLHKVTVVRDSLTAASVGVHEAGVTAMHDATEGGVVAAALELASASETGLRLYLEEIDMQEEVKQVCRLFRINPLTSLSEGSLIISSRPSSSTHIINVLSSKRIDANVVGRLVPKSNGYKSTDKSGTARLSYPRADPYWKAFDKARRKGWN